MAPEVDQSWTPFPPTMYRLHGRVVKGVGHLGHDEAMEAGGREFDPRPGHYSRNGSPIVSPTGAL